MRLIVPRGAEARAVRRAVSDAVVVPPGAASAAALPPFAAGETVVVVGLCGALRELRAGAVVVYARVVDHVGTVELNREMVEAVVRALPNARIVSACTTDRVVTQTAERASLAARYEADAVDMEGIHLGAALAARGVPFAMVRVVSDDASRDLPPIADAIGPDGHVRPLRIARAFARSPRAAIHFVRDVRSSLATLTDVARALSREAQRLTG